MKKYIILSLLFLSTSAYCLHIKGINGLTNPLTSDLQGAGYNVTNVRNVTVSSGTIQGSDFSVGGTTFAVTNGTVKVGGILQIFNPTQSFYGGMVTQVNSSLLNLGLNPDINNIFSMPNGQYNSANQGGYLRWDIRANQPLFSILTRVAGDTSGVTKKFVINADGSVEAMGIAISSLTVTAGYTTGTGIPVMGTNAPISTATPYSWIPIAIGTATCYIPVWK
jgi:hypothetical protein